MIIIGGEIGFAVRGIGKNELYLVAQAFSKFFRGVKAFYSVHV